MWVSNRRVRSPFFRRSLPLGSTACAALLLANLSGCGESSPPVETAAAEWSEAMPAPTSAAEASRKTARNDRDDQIQLTSAETAISDRPEKGSAEWLLMEIAHINTAPLEVIRAPVPGKPGEFKEVRLNSDELAQERVRRNEKTVELAMQAIGKTHDQQSQVQHFNSAVHYLSDARLQLALAGNQEQAQLLDENAEALFSRDATSFAAVEAAGSMLRYSQNMANRLARKDSQWALAFARQARLFAERFPQETSQSAMHLMAAGRLCEQLQFNEEAEACFAVVEQNYPQSPYAEQVAGSLRRLRLTGHPLTEFGGSTFDGGFTSIDRYRGRPLIIAFWASNSAEFREDLPALQTAIQQSGGQLAAVGVNLDRDAQAVRQFLQETGLNWQQIFYSDPEKRGSRNIVAKHYGIISVPEYWLVDSQGIVKSVHLDPHNLKENISQLLAR